MKTLIVQFVAFAASVFASATAAPEGYETSPNDSALVARALQRRNGMLYCGNFAPAEYGMTRHLIDNLRNDNWHTVAPHGCYRAQCYDTSALYICNDNSYTLNVHGHEVVKHLEVIMDKCCLYDEKGGMLTGQHMAGQQFTDAVGGNWNVVIGYGNCRHSSTQKPSDIGGWGVNGIGCRKSSQYVG